MTGKYLLYGTLAAGATLFAWQTVSNVVIPWHEATMTNFPDNGSIVTAVRANAPRNGVYYSPNGILAAVSMTPDLANKENAMGAMMGRQVAIDIVAALLLCVLVVRIGARTRGETALILALGGLVAGMIREFSDWNWYGFAGSYALVNTIDLTISLALAGFVIALIRDRQMGGEARVNAVSAS